MTETSHRLLSLAVFVILAHAGVVIWHLFVVTNMPPGLPSPRIPIVAIAMNAVPVIGLILLLRKTYRFAAILIFLPMAAAFAIGGYEHFLNSGPGSIFDVSDPEWAWQFRVSAILLIALELLGCGIGVRSWSLRVREQTPVPRRRQ